MATCGRKVEIDMPAKGMNQNMLDVAVATGMPVVVSPKYWAEHMGLPYHQTDIRELEVPRPSRRASGLMRFSAGERSFLRYGYGDLLREDRQWGVLYRIWPGTQRILIWGDPLSAAAHSRAFSFCGSDGVLFVDTSISAIGIAQSYVWNSPKPMEFGEAGQNWENIGWKVNVRFTSGTLQKCWTSGPELARHDALWLMAPLTLWASPTPLQTEMGV